MPVDDYEPPPELDVTVLGGFDDRVPAIYRWTVSLTCSNSVAESRMPMTKVPWRGAFSSKLSQIRQLADLLFASGTLKPASPI